MDHRDAGAWHPQHLARRGDAGGRGPDGRHRAAAPAAAERGSDAIARRRVVVAIRRACCISPARWLKAFRQLQPGASSSSCCSAPCVLLACRSRFAFGLATLAYLALHDPTPLTVVVGRMDEGMSHLILLAVPLFVFLGLLIEMTGMARAMVDFLSRCSAMCAADCPMCCSARCIWSPAFPAPRPPTWPRWRRCCFPR